MQEIEFLTERDIEYFRKKEAAGESVHVIDIVPEVFDRLDLDYVSDPIEKSNVIPNEEEIRRWVEKHPVLMEKRKRAEETASKDPVTGLKEGEYTKETEEAEKRPEVIEARKKQKELRELGKQLLEELRYENPSEQELEMLEMAVIWCSKHNASADQLKRIFDAQGPGGRVAAYDSVQKELEKAERLKKKA